MHRNIQLNCCTDIYVPWKMLDEKIKSTQEEEEEEEEEEISKRTKTDIIFTSHHCLCEKCEWTDILVYDG